SRLGAAPRNSLLPVNQPMRSATTCTGADDARHTPPGPRLTATKLATIWPGTKFSTDVGGGVSPHGHAVRNPGSVASVTVTLSETLVAAAVSAAGIVSPSTAPVRASGEARRPLPVCPRRAPV